MRTGRILGEGQSFYHCMSRVVDQRFVFGHVEKEFFRLTMRKLEAFLGVGVVTYCLMDNHFHLLVEVPDREDLEPLDQERLLALLPELYDPEKVAEIADEIERANASGSECWKQEILDRYHARRGDLSVFLKELKQRFTQWYNHRKNRRGTLWEERFKSVLVEGSENALLIMAAYIDLNPIRAKLVEDPSDYRWCGYGEAVAGEELARKGLGRILRHSGLAGEGESTSHWKETARHYRLLLFDQGQERQGDEWDRGVRAGFGQERVEAEQERGGELSLRQVLRCRVRYFCDGAVFGTTAFVESVFLKNRARFGIKRETGARKMKGAAWGAFRVLRDLRQEPIGHR